MSTAGVPSDFPIKSPAAAANSSATARTVAVSNFPSRSRVPRKSKSTGNPDAPMATLVSPSRHGRPDSVYNPHYDSLGLAE